MLELSLLTLPALLAGWQREIPLKYTSLLWAKQQIKKTIGVVMTQYKIFVFKKCILIHADLHTGIRVLAPNRRLPLPDWAACT